MAVTWLHVSDFHFRGGDPYDRDVVLKALVESVAEYRRRGRQPDLIFATGDVAHGGKPDEYKAATKFFDALLAAAGVKKRRLFVIPGNHDVDRDEGHGLARTFDSREEADRYFAPGKRKAHLRDKLGTFAKWYDGYFSGIRKFPKDTTCGPAEIVEVDGRRLGVLPVNSALFCQDDHDHGKLLVGRRCLDSGVAELGKLKPEVTIGLIHHPLDWLHDVERSNISAKLRDNADIVLRGHLHEIDAEHVTGVSGTCLHIAAGAAHQSRKWPNRALYATLEGDQLDLFPIRYEDNPREVWTTDPSVFPKEPGHSGKFALPHRHAAPAAAPVKPEPPQPATRQPTAFRCNIPSLGSLPFVGRDAELQEIGERLSDPAKGGRLVLHGQPGVGKSELAREFGRRGQARYPGGAFFISAASGAAAVDLARIGSNILGLSFPPDLGLEDQCLRTLFALGGAPVLLIFDNVESEQAIAKLLPPVGRPYQVLITSVVDIWGADWPAMRVRPLDDPDSLKLVRAIAGDEATDRYGGKLVENAGGLPIQLVPAAKTVAYEVRRGRDDKAAQTLTSEASASFSGVYNQLDDSARLLLLATRRMNAQRILEQELRECLLAGASWTQTQFSRALDACLDVQVLQGDAPARRMHQLFADFVRDGGDDAPETVAAAQAERLLAVAREVVENPGRTDSASVLLSYSLRPNDWNVAISPVDGSAIGVAAYEIGQFETARPWFERAVAEAEKGDVHGRVDHASLGTSLHDVGSCLFRTGRFEAARPWFERAVAEAEKGDVHGRVDDESLGSSLHLVGYCLSSAGQFEAARPLFERAVAEAEKGDVHGRVDHASLGRSLHQVGYCLASAGQFEAARPLFERAVAEAEKGDVHGRVDHASLGRSLHLVGYCLSSAGQFEAARPLFERAVAEAEKGDVHGRVDHASLGRSLHLVGYCLSSAGQFEAARPWFERAVAENEKGDLHGRVDHASLGVSLHLVGYCLSSAGQFEAARPWFERAVGEMEKGDVHGRVDHASLGSSVHQVGYCLSCTGHSDAARSWFERAVAEKEKGDVHGRVDHANLGRSLHQVGDCLASDGQFEAARPWFERAVAEAEKGDVYGRVDQESVDVARQSLAECLGKLSQPERNAE